MVAPIAPPIWATTERPLSVWAATNTDAARLVPLIDRWVSEGRLVPVVGTGARWMLHDGYVLAIWQLTHCLRGWTPETLRAGLEYGNDATEPRHPEYIQRRASWGALAAQAAQSVRDTTVADARARGQQTRQADHDERFAIVRSEWRGEGDSAKALHGRLSDQGTEIPLSTIYRYLKKILT